MWLSLVMIYSWCVAMVIVHSVKPAMHTRLKMITIQWRVWVVWQLSTLLMAMLCIISVVCLCVGVGVCGCVGLCACVFVSVLYFQQIEMSEHEQKNKASSPNHYQVTSCLETSVSHSVSQSVCLRLSCYVLSKCIVIMHHWQPTNPFVLFFMTLQW